MSLNPNPPVPTPLPHASTPRALIVARALAVLGGLGWFLWLGGGAVLPPTRIDWMMREDWAAHIFGWLFFRNADWQLPLGAAPNHFFPYGTSVALTDGNPWAAVLLKPFSALLPADFQYTGPWLGLCYALMGYFGARLVETVSPRAVPVALGGTLLALSPVMAARFSHPTLCAHWLLVALLWLHLRDTPDARTATRSLGLAALFNAIAAGTHPYWVAMLVPLTLALGVRLVWSRKLGLGRVAGACVGIIGLDVLLFAAFGYFGGQGLGAEGFGEFSSDLATLVNPLGWSRLLPDLPAGPRQGEGFGYLGAGALLLCVLAVMSVLLRPREARTVDWRRVLPAAFVVLLMGVYALSSRVTWLGQPVADLGALYAPLAKATNAFRASGRFVWPLHYLLVVGAVLTVVRLWRAVPAVAMAALTVALAVQAYDGREDKSALFKPVHFQRLQSPEWAALQGPYQHLALFPPHAQWVCRYDEPLVNALAYQAYRLKLTFNSGYASRTPQALEADCHARLPRDGLDAATAYVVLPEHLRPFLDAGARCGVVEGLPVCVVAGNTDAFAQGLLRQPLR
ncbi:DUF6311 domain-containing protein [Corallococcus sicarius]|uniref:Glycosyltransferase RgtA/B/C/D-like domain-containing protein n=1 Tax=Corallococcus sicarius TaxID=2316726 RepID=A0A3A8MXG2_9BACT|nr:DUF6311 domain-containing protein [Corallococcus sicarius]RKH36736.1 hypothetical protein D7X12_32165 [Corallococcus sicarius]